MINRLAKAQKSWIAKLILSLTALSFMSLFGVSSYLASAGKNRTVIKVDNIEVSQEQFSYLLQKETNIAKNLMGENYELGEDARAALIAGLAQSLVQNAVLDRTAQKYHIAFRPSLIQSIIFNEPSFRDNSGNFRSDIFRRVLSDANMSESEYIGELKRDLTRQLVISQQVKNLNVPEVLLNAETKVDNKRRTFKYVSVKPEEMKIGRRISEEEIAQYYEDFIANFMEPERRNLSVMHLSMDDIAGQVKIDDEDIRFYYDEHRDEYETPEMRHILQMMFDDEKEANKAYFELQNGKDFYAVASDLANQTREDTDLGFAARDELVDDVSEEVFALAKGGYTKPMPVGDMWQIMKTEDIKQASKTPYAQASAKIAAELKNERLYDVTYDILAQIEDSLGAGEDLAAVAGKFNTQVLNVEGLADDGSSRLTAKSLNGLEKSPEFIDAAFSYAGGETSQVIETDDGLVVIRVDEIVETHPKELGEVRGEIEQLWANGEKAAIAQELLNDVMHDLENGDDLSSVAKRYGLTVYKSQPITRNETFANIGYSNIREMFTEPLGTPRQIQQGENYVIAVAVNDYTNSVPLSKSELNWVKHNANQSLTHDFAEALLKSYADEYNIKVKYKLIGLDDL